MQIRRRTRWYVLALVCAVIMLLFGLGAYQITFTTPPQPELFTIGPNGLDRGTDCSQVLDVEPIDNNGRLNLLVWNLYKQNRPNWRTALHQLSQDSELLLLQEVSLSSSFLAWLREDRWQASYVRAFDVFATPTGVASLARSKAEIACPFTTTEPWMRLPKSALYSLYPLSNGQVLAIINIHAINFSLGIEAYRQQLETAVTKLKAHRGPMLVAGDFNAWQGARLTLVQQLISELALTPVTFSEDNRTRFAGGLALDYVFYRGLEVLDARVPITDASDHNPLIVRFATSL